MHAATDVERCRRPDRLHGCSLNPFAFSPVALIKRTIWHALLCLLPPRLVGILGKPASLVQ